MLLSDRFGWTVTFNDDVDDSVFLKQEDVRGVDWDLAIWGNESLARLAREHASNKSSTSVIPRDWQLYMANSEVYAGLMGRVPYTEFRCSQILEMASGHIIKANAGLTKVPFAVYNNARGVWEWDDPEGAGESVYKIVTDVLTLDFAEALNRAADLAEHIAEVVLYNPTGDKPTGAAATAADKIKWQKQMDEYKKQMEKVKRVRDMDRAMPKTASMRAILSEWKSLCSTGQKSWDSDMSWIVLADRAINVQDILNSNGDPEVVYDYPHSPTHMSTMALSVSWAEMNAAMSRDPDSTMWYSGVKKVLPDPGVRKYLQKRFGAALLGRPGSVGKSMVWQYGRSDAAKSTIQECIAGEEGVFSPYSFIAESTVLTLDGRRTGETSRFLAYVRGKRFAIMSELNAGMALYEAGLKTMTGGESVQGTAKYANSVSYKFTATMFMASNHAPSISSGDPTAIKRIHVVPFNHVLWRPDTNPVEYAEASEDHRADLNWQDKILKSDRERSAVLAWVLDGLFMFAKEGIGELPAEMVETRDNFVEAEKPVSGQLLDYMLTGGDYDQPWLSLYTDTEWTNAGFAEGDGITVERFKALLDMAAAVSGVCSAPVPENVRRAASRTLNDMGGASKKIWKADLGKTKQGFSRVRENAPVTYFFDNSQRAGVGNAG